MRETKKMSLRTTNQTTRNILPFQWAVTVVRLKDARQTGLAGSVREV
jgi:hypothetical protein